MRKSDKVKPEDVGEVRVYVPPMSFVDGHRPGRRMSLADFDAMPIPAGKRAEWMGDRAVVYRDGPAHSAH